MQLAFAVARRGEARSDHLFGRWRRLASCGSVHRRHRKVSRCPHSGDINPNQKRKVPPARRRIAAKLRLSGCGDRHACPARRAGPRWRAGQKGRARWHAGTRRRRSSRARRCPSRASAEAEPGLAASDRARRRRDRRHRHPDPDRRRRRQGRAGGDPLLRHRRPDLRRRRAGLCRDGDDDPGLGQRLYLHLCRARRVARLDRRLEPDPRIFAGGERGRGGLVGLCLALARSLGRFPARADAKGPELRRRSSTCRPSSSSRSSPAC